jgi:prophage regulatory protein
VSKKILTYPELENEGVRVGRRQLDRLEAAGLFPKRVQISPGRVGWLHSEIKAHVSAAIARRPVRIGTNDEPVGLIHA